MNRATLYTCRMKKLLDSTSKVKVGLDYERLVVAVLRGYSFQLKHTGRSGDEGQDFTGNWSLPHRNIPVVGQCKCWKKAVGPKEVREFEDVLYRKFVQVQQGVLGPALGSYQDGGHLGLMISRSWFSKASLKTFHSSKMAMMFMQILENSETDNRMEPKDTDMESDSHIMDPNNTEQNSTSHFNLGSGLESKYRNIPTPGNSTGSEPPVSSNTIPDLSGATDNNSELPCPTRDPVSHMTSGCDHTESTSEEKRAEEDRVMLTDTQTKVAGYVNEMVLNSKALGIVGDVQLTWEWNAGQQQNKSQRQLILTLGK